MLSAGIPFAVVENPIVRALTNTHLHAETISARVRSIAGKVETEIVSIGTTVQVGVLCFDEWTSGANESFLSVEMCRLTGEYEYVQVWLEHLPLGS